MLDPGIQWHVGEPFGEKPAGGLSHLLQVPMRRRKQPLGIKAWP